VFGLDDLIAGATSGHSPFVVVALAVVLGLRHATDPDHLVAVSTLVASDRDRAGRRAGALGLAWGAGHGTAIVALGLPFVLLAVLIPAPVQTLAEALVGVVIVALAFRLLHRWRRGAFHGHAHRHGDVVHRHLHAHGAGAAHAHTHRVRSPLGAYAVGALHGVGGSAPLALLLLAGIDDRAVAAAALLAFAVGAAVSMAVLSTGIGLALGLDSPHMPVRRVVPGLGACSLAFGVLYAGGALAAIA
jgi:sulfite exporter TauE/SafE